MYRSLIWLTLATLLTGLALAGEKPRVFVTDSKSWEIRASSGGAGGVFGGSMSGGARPQTAEIIKTFGQKCPAVTINNKQDKADYVVLLDHEGGKGFLRKDNKVAVFNRAGDSIVSKSTLSVGGSVEEACKAIVAEWEKNGGKSVGTETKEAQPEMSAKLQLSSAPSGADIELDGSFVGNTPSNLALKPGDYSVTIKKNGYKPWSRKLKVSGGEVSIIAELEKNP